ncbi:Uncharacterized conserved protein YqhQ [Alkalithermobacter thermoalcaliphilus JW-YL-7 = DSM 7308]|uniref:Uncharacterized conserved protein YqhQ n=1 Tax=Alkalithermobacter thermoalcaliphilus JW-YL-7 = DSM 7308 TaxID=1121328 RepID=A0A150FSD7_CLOPD|nr:protein of unknown function DUF1385 [[Clostridium] paradoxum JW-YL-7 = DSM 7308]SHK71305.1 Uncharacterized conserved protein YqhQ [[Clostridium] paradoxum JW-YL-7 = DSM 7308]
MKKEYVGGQAVIEGVMMKSDKKVAVAVRKPDGKIAIKKRNLTSRKSKFFKAPFIRGSFILIQSLVDGIKSLNYSAEFFEVEDEPSRFEKFLNKIFKEKANDLMIYFSIFLSLLFSVILFMLLPTFLGSLFKFLVKNTLVLNLFEGIIRISIFIGYVYLISLNDDIKRVFQYHGAEHKAIHCYENDLPLEVENAKSFTTIHARCGTNFMFVVMIISMLLFSLFGWPNPYLRVFYRLILLPVVAGISYEVIKLFSKYDNKVIKILSLPGMYIQKITTKEPDDSQLEVALLALRAVIEDKESEYDNKEDFIKVN